MRLWKETGWVCGQAEQTFRPSLKPASSSRTAENTDDTDIVSTRKQGEYPLKEIQINPSFTKLQIQIYVILKSFF